MFFYVCNTAFAAAFGKGTSLIAQKIRVGSLVCRLRQEKFLNFRIIRSLASTNPRESNIKCQFLDKKYFDVVYLEKSGALLLKEKRGKKSSAKKRNNALADGSCTRHH